MEKKQANSRHCPVHTLASVVWETQSFLDYGYLTSAVLGNIKWKIPEENSG